MAVSSVYTFAGATSPVAGSNGNPFGSVTTALTINSTGIVTAGYYEVVNTAAGSTITGFGDGYTFEIKFKTSTSPGGERRIFTPSNTSSGNTPVSIVRSGSQAVVVHYNTAVTSITTPSGFFLYDGVFHTYKFVYNGTTVTYFKDGVSVGSQSIGTPATTYNPNSIYIVGSMAGLAADAPPSDITVEYASISIGAETPPPPSSTDYISPVSRGIFRGIERGIA
jgi:hypothetical protein